MNICETPRWLWFVGHFVIFTCNSNMKNTQKSSEGPASSIPKKPSKICETEIINGYFHYFFIPVTDQNGCHEYWPFVQLVVWIFSNMTLYAVYQIFLSIYFYDQVNPFHHRANEVFQFEKVNERWKDLHHSQPRLFTQFTVALDSQKPITYQP